MISAKTTPRLLWECRRGDALDRQKAAVEIGDVVETDVKAVRGDVFVGLHKQLTGARDAHANQALSE